ncbi:hypothetical protein HPQ64_19565 [Rhizobiales bacterium]|uniref:DUF937 domain-containing protein n=1 Tax=Hongsoonwoonella zoysiae TaxID=2821844 RepID=UPI00155FCD9A|nr:DUF937 domain-containing protein [Hongsoonwoonella zoysiae]NRG19898.1 hypothetical protein [Hongsoonwoonella zoysiae]
MSDAFGFPQSYDPQTLAAHMRKQFGWSDQDFLKASENLMSAALAGLRHNASSPAGLQSLIAMMPGPGAAWSAPRPEGFFGEPLALFFGPADVQARIIEQVTNATGLGRQGVETMMPVVATLTLGNLARQFTAGPARDMLDAFLAGYARGRPKPTPKPEDYLAPYAEAMQSFWDGYMRAFTPEQPQEEAEAETAAEIPDTEDASPQEPVAETPSDENISEAWLDIGRNIQETQIRAFEKLFEQSSRQPGK